MYKILLLCLIITYSSAQNSPVFLWGSTTSSISVPAFKPINKLDFIDFLEPEIKSSMFLVFLENDLKTEDLTLCKQSNGKTCFTNLSGYKSKSFLTDVEDPVEALKSVSSKNEVVEINDKLSEDIEFENGKIVFIKFTKETDNRNVKLNEHDSIIANIYNKLALDGNVIGIYTSNHSMAAKQRVRRQAAAAGTKVQAPGVLLYYKEAKIRTGNKTEAATISAIDVKKDSSRMEVTFSGADLKFSILLSGGYWVLINTTFKGDPVNADTYALTDFSHYCGKKTFSNAARNQSITFIDFQMQVDFKSTGPPTKFGDAYHCDGFMSIGIWMGLFAGFIYLIILYFGITWILDINANDRFEDPKGKTIVVAQET